MPTLTVPAVTRTRRRTPSSRATDTAYDAGLLEHAAALRTTAETYQRAGNLEQTLGAYLDLCLTLQHLEQSPAKTNTAARKAKTHKETLHVLGVLEQLHQQVQSKKAYYHGCLDEDGDGDEPSADPSRTRLACDGVVPLDAGASTVTLASIVGNEAIKQDILNGIVQPFKQPLLFKVRRSFLFYGPPGTGKTMFAKAAAHSLDQMTPELGVLYFAPTTDALKDKYVGGTERKITQYFRCVQQHAEERARESGKPALGIIFIDEIDSLARSRDSDDPSGTTASATNTLLQMMDGFTALPNVIVMAATNYPWQLDSAVLSRFQEKVYVRLPDLTTVQALLRHNLLQFYQRALGIDDATDPLAEKHTGTDSGTARFEVLSHLFGVTDEKLLAVARRLCQPLTYSPSNIRDVCERVFRKNARQAHESGIFHEVRVAFSSEAFRRCSRVEQGLLHHMHRKYASATTYTALRRAYAAAIEETNGVNVHGGDGQKGGGGSRSHARPDRLTVGDAEYVYAPMWSGPSAQAPLVDALAQLPHVFVYVRVPEDGGGETTAPAPATAPTPPFEYAVYQSYHTLFGKGSVHRLEMVATGSLDDKAVESVMRYVGTGVLNMQRFLETAFERVVRTSPTRLLVERATAVYVHDTHAAATTNRSWLRLPSHPHMLTAARVASATQGTSDAPVDLHTADWATTKGLERFAMWLCGADTGKRVEATGVVQPKGDGVPVTLHRNTTGDIAATTRRQVEQRAFTLHVDVDSFFDAVDSERNADAVLPTSSKKEVEKLERYWRGEMG